MNKFTSALDNYFKISERKSKFSTEIIAGITTFLAMAYILAVNPNVIVGPGSSLWNSVFMATAISAVVGTLLMALIAKLPFAQAPGMGLNTQMMLITASFAAVRYTFGGALAIVLISGILFLLITLVGLREKIFDGIPVGIRAAIPVGIGLFIAFIGLQGAGIIVKMEGILVSLVNFKDLFAGGAAAVAVSGALVAFFGLIVIAVLSKFKIKGAVLIGILASTLLGIPLGVTHVENITQGWNIVQRMGDFFSRNPETGTFFMFDFINAFRPEVIFSTIMLIITFSMIDMFDTIGTLFGCASKANLLDEKGNVVNFKKAMYADSIATVVGACLGTSTVTTFVESGAGVAEGGKTGFASVITAILFLLAIFISPVFAVIPSAATAPALIYVGVLMISTVKNIDFSDIRIAVPAFLTIVIMPLGYSITNGIGIGIISYVLIAILCYVIDIIKYAARNKAASEEGNEIVKPKWPISVVTAIIAVLFIIMFFMPTKI